MIDSNNKLYSLSKSLIEATRGVMEGKKLDPVGKETADIDNDGDVDKSDKYLHNRRKTIATSMKNEEVEEIDELSDAKKKDYLRKAVGVEPHPNPIKKMMGKKYPNSVQDLGDKTTHLMGKKISKAMSGGDISDKEQRELERVSTKAWKRQDIATKTGYKMGLIRKEEVEDLDEDLGAQISELIRKKNAATSPIARKNIELQIAKLKRQKPKVNEEAEQIDELSRKTLSSYVKKAANSAANKGMEHGVKKAEADEMDRVMNRHMSFGDKDKVRGIMKTTSSDVDKPREKAMRRLQGIDRAANRLAKEDVELTQEEIENLEAIMAEMEEIDEARGRPRKNPLPAGQQPTAPEPRQHIMQQLQRAKLSMQGGAKVTFKDGSTHDIHGAHASKVLDKYAGMKPAEKEAYQKKIGASHAAFKSEL